MVKQKLTVNTVGPKGCDFQRSQQWEISFQASLWEEGSTTKCTPKWVEMVVLLT